MNKYIKFILFTSFILLLLTGCQEKNEVMEQPELSNQSTLDKSVNSSNTTNDTEKESGSVEKAAAMPSTEIKEELKNQDIIINNTFLSSVAKGEIKSCQFSLEDKITIGEIIEKLGNPEYEDFLEGAYGRLYGNCIYSAIDENLDSPLTGIYYSSDKLTLTPTEIRSILGIPASDGINEMDGGYFMEYNSGNYTATLYFESEDSPVNNVYIN